MLTLNRNKIYSIGCEKVSLLKVIDKKSNNVVTFESINYAKKAKLLMEKNTEIWRNE